MSLADHKQLGRKLFLARGTCTVCSAVTVTQQKGASQQEAWPEDQAHSMLAHIHGFDHKCAFTGEIVIEEVWIDAQTGIRIDGVQIHKQHAELEAWYAARDCDLEKLKTAEKAASAEEAARGGGKADGSKLRIVSARDGHKG